MWNHNAPGNTRKLVVNKFKNVLKKNTRFKTIRTIYTILEGEQNSTQGLPENLKLDDMVYLTFAPLVSFNVKRSFSIYKSIFSDHGRQFLFENILKNLNNSIQLGYNK